MTKIGKTKVVQQDKQLLSFTGGPLWKELNSYIKSAYGIKPQISEIAASHKQKWCVEYHINQQSLCTLYPKDNQVTAVLFLKDSDTEEAVGLLEQLSPFGQEIYQQTFVTAGGRWLILEIDNRQLLQDLILFLMIKVAPRLQYKAAKNSNQYAFWQTLLVKKQTDSVTVALATNK